MSDSETPIFILGVGAQKAGTSWLHKQLTKSPLVNMGFTKEYHVWDAVFCELATEFRADPKIGEGADHVLRRMMQSDQGFYERYFSQLVDRTTRWTGDITPSYSMLGAKDFGEIKRRLEDAGFTVKVVFLMRDPVERNWSALRMHQRVRSEEGIYISGRQLNEMFEDFFRTPGAVARTRYDATISALREAFPFEDLYVGFYESLFSEASIRNISTFLNLDLSHADKEEKVNASKVVALDEELYESCREFYADVYSFCAREYPETERLWLRRG
jgi:hypothetical protein